MHNTQLLAWDSRILGISVAKILDLTLDEQKLGKALQQLKHKGVKLVYWLIDSHDDVAIQAALACGGFLADEKITYYLHLTQQKPLPFPYLDVEIYQADHANKQLEAIAIEIGQFSRFSRDPKLTSAQMHRVYKTWIDNACKKTVAKIVLVIKREKCIIAMVTIDEKQNRGDLSLIGVNPHYQGQGLGKRLVYAALAWCMTQHYHISQVVTQQTNVKAKHLYESCGFQQEKTQYFYHFWL